MKKIIGVLSVAVFSMALFFNTANANSSNGDFDLISLINMNEANAECVEGTPNTSCPMWDVKITVGWPDNTLECSSGGSYKCEIDW